VSGSGISWAICKSAPCSWQITTPASHRSFFTGRMPFLLPNQQCQSTEGTGAPTKYKRQWPYASLKSLVLSLHLKQQCSWCNKDVMAGCSRRRNWQTRSHARHTKDLSIFGLSLYLFVSAVHQTGWIKGQPVYSHLSRLQQYWTAYMTYGHSMSELDFTHARTHARTPV